MFVIRLVRRLGIDPFLLLLIAAVLLSVVLPVRGETALVYDRLTDGAIALLFLSQGMKLSRRQVVDGLIHWRLHLVVLGATFLLFPLVGMLMFEASKILLPQQLALGILFLTLLPSTVQSSIAFTAIAGGNVAAAVCSASLSNLLGIVLTPLFAALLMRTSGSVSLSWTSVGSIMGLILLPFVIGHLSRPWTAAFAHRHRRPIGWIDRGSIILVVYGAFSASVVARFWSAIEPSELLITLGLCAVILAVVLAATAAVARKGGFDRADRIAIIFCGSKKSLASGVPIASALFPVAALGGIILPLMIFHQLQLFACSLLARRFAGSAEEKASSHSDASESHG
jgi:sodium/bile acid cotransporter 7